MARAAGSVKYVRELTRELMQHHGLAPIKLLLKHQNGTHTEYAIKRIIGAKDDRGIEIIIEEHAHTETRLDGDL